MSASLKVEKIHLPGDPLLGIAQTRAYLAGCSRSYVYKLMKRGVLSPDQYVGARPAFRLSQLEMAIKEGRV